MAFWIKAGNNPGSSRRVKFIMDSDSDKDMLPTSTAPGKLQDGGDVINMPVGKGSVAFSIATGKTFMLNSVDEWTEIGGDANGGGGGSNDLFKLLIEQEPNVIDDTEGIITKIGSYAFDNCSTLTSVNFPSCENVGAYAFQNCNSLSTISFPVCTSIGKNAFVGCSLATANFPVCTSIGEFAFTSCFSLTTASFPACTSIEQYAFAGCPSLATISFPVCEHVGSIAFMFCDSLTEVNFPACTIIDVYAFSGCRSLATASFPVCEYVENNAFQNCSSLMSLYLLGSSVVTLSSSNAFMSTPMSNSTYTGSFGSIYVPASLYNQYISANQWSAYSDRFVSVS